MPIAVPSGSTVPALRVSAITRPLRVFLDRCRFALRGGLQPAFFNALLTAFSFAPRLTLGTRHCLRGCGCGLVVGGLSGVGMISGCGVALDEPLDRDHAVA